MAAEGILGILTNFVIVILLGLGITLLAKKIRISNILLLLIAGLVIGWFAKQNDVLQMSDSAVITIAIIALVLIIFDGSSRFEIRALDHFSVSTLKLTGYFFLFNIVILTLGAAFLLFGNISILTILYGMVFASILSGTDPASIFVMLKNKTNKVIEFLEIEGIMNTPVIVIFPFVILDVINQVTNQSIISFNSYASGFFTQILVGIGAGIFVGLVFFKAMRHFYADKISEVAIISSSLLAYILAENLGGNGVLSVAVLGFMFGNIYVSHKEVLMNFNSTLSNFLEILVFILIGFTLNINLETGFVLKSVLLFLLLILTRYLAVQVSLKESNYTPSEKLFMVLNMPKGIAVAVLIFSLSLRAMPELDVLNNAIILIVVYSLLLSTVVNKFSLKLINIDLDDKKPDSSDD